MAIRPIETVYNGYRFRSRLEARWAVFFDALGIKYEYEKEGYDLGEGGWYLPDFWLSDFRLWTEIKSEHPTKNEWNKLEMLHHTLIEDVMFIWGSPIPDRHGLAIWTESDGSMGWDETETGVFLGCRRCKTGIWACDMESYSFMVRIGGCTNDRCFDRYPIMTEKIQTAYIAARQARFGKNGRG